MAYLSSGHVGPWDCDDGATMQQIADALAGDGLKAVSLDYSEVEAMHEALDQCEGNRTLAAKQLGMSRGTLRQKLKRAER